jgi:hypothetical protein
MRMTYRTTTAFSPTTVATYLVVDEAFPTDDMRAR